MPRVVGNGSGVTITTTTEQVGAVSAPISAPVGTPFALLACVDVTTGTGVNGLTINLRRGSAITGQIVQGFGPEAVAASTRYIRTVAFFDTIPSEQAGLTYCVCVLQASATGNGTINTALVRADWGYY